MLNHPPHFSIAIVLGVCLAAGRPVPAAPPLTADQLLLVYNQRDPESVELAEYYAKARRVPADRLCPLEIQSTADEISRAEYERLIRDPIRDFLTRRGLRDKVRCLVTFYGVPIRVGSQAVWPDAAQLRAKWQAEFAEGLRAFEDLVRELQTMAAPSIPSSMPATRPAEDDLRRFYRGYNAAKQDAFERIQRLRQQKTGEEQGRRMLAIFEEVEGAGRLLSLLSPNPGADRATAEQQIEQAKRKLKVETDAAHDLLALAPPDPARDRGRQILRRYEGLLVYLLSLQNDLLRLETAESKAAVDSELMLLWWRTYPSTRWVWNPLSWRNRADPGLRNALPPGDSDLPVLMVARLDGPISLVVRTMIADAVDVEKRGLFGKFYLDARGLKQDEGAGRYDQSLRDLAVLARDAGLDVTLDDAPALFLPRTCPDAALYCGWYSVRKYVDAFTFVPGAIGYHLGSFEAVSLKAPNETGWCRGLLLDGAAATIGPVAEPYLESFPSPKEFFGLLLTGRFTLAECYAYTARFGSWMQMLLGDPLYMPFAAAPPVRLEQVFEDKMIPPGFRSTRK